ncbi:ABC transporter family substrate-binding protein [Corynebacterium sp. H113]|uniref:ABC transporter family substrate-binding protein n=1 Tax=Corynebacterium sp. H113 TaxID=3133419 RepID=UPI0030B2F491
MSIRRRRFRPALLAGLVSTAFLASCMANPGEAPTVAEDPKPQDQAKSKEDREKQLRTINIGVDEFGEGFNPHLISDQSPLTDLIASLTLPSAFIPDPADPTTLVQDKDVLDDVTVDTVTTNGTKNTHIRYDIREGAQWSDGTPISGEDFRYLHRKIVETPGVAHSAGYEQIDHIEVSGGGRRVDVYFDGEIVGYQELFRHLLPSHLLRASTSGFESLLATSVPASGGRYSVLHIDVGRNEVRLARNDRFWGDNPATTENVVLRLAGKDVAGAQQMRSNQLQAAYVRPAETTVLTYGLVPDAVTEEFDAPRTLSASLNMASVRLDDVAVRRELLDSINVDEIASVATGRRAIENPDQVEESSTPATETASDEAPEGAPEMTAFTEEQPLRLGAMGEDPQVQAAAFAIADQLTAAGIPAEVTTSSAIDLTRSLLPWGEVDMVVSWGESVNTRLQARDRYSCPETTRPSLKPKNTATTKGSTSVPSSTSESSSGASNAEFAAPAATARAGNLSGICDPEIDELLQDPGTEVPPELSSLIDERAVEMPIATDHMLTVVGPGAIVPRNPEQKEWPSSPWTGRLMTIPLWERVVMEEAKNSADE